LKASLLLSVLFYSKYIVFLSRALLFIVSMVFPRAFRSPSLIHDTWEIVIRNPLMASLTSLIIELLYSKIIEYLFLAG
jgi:hypothetical protein